MGGHAIDGEDFVDTHANRLQGEDKMSRAALAGFTESGLEGLDGEGTGFCDVGHGGSPWEAGWGLAKRGGFPKPGALGLAARRSQQAVRTCSRAGEAGRNGAARRPQPRHRERGGDRARRGRERAPLEGTRQRGNVASQGLLPREQGQAPRAIREGIVTSPCAKRAA